jgi:glutathione synthase/RimK-type ligase-like ATP-grasp enzyme
MADIVFVTDREHTDLVPGDRMLLENLEERGHTVDVQVWDDRDVRWSDYDLVLLRETWDYERKYKTFLQWIDHLDELPVRVMNPPNVLRWNANKQYLKDLENSGVPIPPSFFVPEGAPVPLEKVLDEKGWSEFVIKPLVGAGAFKLERFTLEELSEAQEHLENLAANRGAIVQKFLPEVEEEGEWSFLFTGGELSHTVLKQPAEDEYRVQKALGGTRHHREADPSIARQAEEYAGTITQPFLYLRLDGIVSRGRLRVVEMELIEPRLYLEGSEEGVENFADAIHETVEEGLKVRYFEAATSGEIELED